MSISFVRRAARWIAPLALMAVIPNVGSAASTYSNASITQVQVYNHGVLIVFTPVQPDTEGCTTSNAGYAWIDWLPSSTPEKRAMLAAALAAQAAGKKLSIGVGGCTADGYYPKIYAVRVLT